MLTLQKTFRYGADPSKLPFSNVPIRISYPVFTFKTTQSPTSGGIQDIIRETAANGSITFSQQLSSKVYFTPPARGWHLQPAADRLPAGYA